MSAVPRIMQSTPRREFDSVVCRDLISASVEIGADATDDCGPITLTVIDSTPGAPPCDTLPRTLDAPLHHVIDTQLTAQLSYVHGAPFVTKAGIARRHREPAVLGKIDDDVRGDAVDKVLLCRIRRQIAEAQHGDGRARPGGGLAALWSCSGLFAILESCHEAETTPVYRADH